MNVSGPDSKEIHFNRSKIEELMHAISLDELNVVET